MERGIIRKTTNPFEKLFSELQILEKELLPSIFKVADEEIKKTGYVPAFPVKVKEDEEKYEVIAEIPGVEKDKIEILYNEEDKVLKIKVEKKEEKIKEDEKIHFSYISYGTFEENILLPEEVDETRINAKYENGILKIEIPKVKKEETEKVKKIQIS